MILAILSNSFRSFSHETLHLVCACVASYTYVILIVKLESCMLLIVYLRQLSLALNETTGYSWYEHLRRSDRTKA